MKHLMVLFAFCGLVTIAGCGGSEPTVVEGTVDESQASMTSSQMSEYEAAMQSGEGSSGPGN